jgi:hypothetical protein
MKTASPADGCTSGWQWGCSAEAYGGCGVRGVKRCAEGRQHASTARPQKLF